MENIFTCKCGYQLTLKKEALGKKVKCKGCNEILDIPADIGATQIESTPTSTSREKPTLAAITTNEIECPFCIERIPKTSLTCPFCKENLAKKLGKGLDQEQINQYLAEQKSQLENEDYENLKIKKKYSLGVIILFFITLGLFVGGIVCIAMDSANTAGLILFSIFAGIFVIPLIIYHLNDKKAQKIQDIKDPVLFIKQYFNSIKSGRGDYVYHVIAPLGRSATSTKLLSFNNVQTDKKKFDITTINGFYKYCKSIHNGDGTNSKRTVLGDIRIVEEYEDKVILEITLKLSSYKRMLIALVLINLIVAAVVITFSTKKDTVKIKKTILKHDNNWFVAEGEFQGNLDFATFKQENI